MNSFYKNLIRKEILNKRKNLSVSERRIKSFIIQETTIQFTMNRKIKRLFSYNSCHSEVGTSFINNFFLHQDIETGFPRVDQNKIDFYKVSNLENDFEKGSFGILEPKKELPLMQYNHIELIITPGVSFSLDGNRLGYGKGLYDRFLLQQSHILRLGLAFECQIVEKLPVENHDQKMHFLITEKKIYKCYKK